MKYELKSQGTVTLALFEGSINYSSAGSFDDAIKTIIEIQPTDLVLDFAKVPTMDSVGLGLMVGIRDMLPNARIRIRGVGPHLKRLMDLTAADSIFEMAD